MTRLTALQLETLALIRDGKVTNTNTGYGSWRILGASPNAVGRLRASGLAIEKKVDERTHRFDLTDAGLAALPSSPSPQSALG